MVSTLLKADVGPFELLHVYTPGADAWSAEVTLKVYFKQTVAIARFPYNLSSELLSLLSSKNVFQRRKRYMETHCSVIVATGATVATSIAEIEKFLSRR